MAADSAFHVISYISGPEYLLSAFEQEELPVGRFAVFLRLQYVSGSQHLVSSCRSERAPSERINRTLRSCYKRIAEAAPVTEKKVDWIVKPHLLGLEVQDQFSLFVELTRTYAQPVNCRSYCTGDLIICRYSCYLRLCYIRIVHSAEYFQPISGYINKDTSVCITKQLLKASVTQKLSAYRHVHFHPAYSEHAAFACIQEQRVRASSDCTFPEYPYYLFFSPDVLSSGCFTCDSVHIVSILSVYF